MTSAGAAGCIDSGPRCLVSEHHLLGMEVAQGMYLRNVAAGVQLGKQK